MKDRELMQMALDALGLFASDESDDGQMAIAAYVALRDRLAQPEPELVVWVENLTDPQPHAVTDLKYCSVAQHESGEYLKYIPLYTAPPKREWVGLTHDEATHLVERFGSDPLYLLYQNEVKLKEKNSG